MIEELEPVYQEHSSCLFQIIRASEVDRSGGLYSDFSKYQLTVRRMHFASQTVQTVLQRPVKALTLDEQKAQYEDVELWLKVRCIGLLEIVVPRESKRPSFTWLLVKVSQIRELDYHIDYIHRTACDFLYREDIWPTIAQYSKKNSKTYKPFLSLLGGAVL
jgi:hypothetical protein